MESLWVESGFIELIETYDSEVICGGAIKKEFRVVC